MKIENIPIGNPTEAIENIKSVTDNALLEAYHNAYTTACLALGHGKSQANKGLAEKWFAEIQERKLTSKIDRENKGIFNGNGSTWAKKERKLTMKTIDITPTWSTLILPMVEVLKNPKADPQVKKEITTELIKLAKIVDEQNEKIRKGN